MTLPCAVRKSLSLFMLILTFTCCAAAEGQDPLLDGYVLTAKDFAGPSRSLFETDPIWVYDYHTLVLDYSGTGTLKSGVDVLILRPGSIGPVTPHADNPENPQTSGADIIAVRGQDLILDGKPHTLKIDLKDKLKVPQIDGLRFIVPAGVDLKVAKLRFLGDAGMLPCPAKNGELIPKGSLTLTPQASLHCGNAVATSLRGRESIVIKTGNRRSSTLYMDLYLQLAGFTNFDPALPSRPKEMAETTMVIAKIRYAGSSTEVEQFPILVEEHRHTLLNQKRALYALKLDPGRRVERVELVDRSPHLQLLLFGAALSNQTVESADNQAVPVDSSARNSYCTAENILGESEWFRVTNDAGKPANDIKGTLNKSTTENGINFSVTLANHGQHAEDVLLSFPSLKVKVTTDASDAWYLFPGKVATISSKDATLSADYGLAFQMQFTDVFAAKARCGAAVLVHDTSGQSKVFTMRKDGETVLDETQYRVHIEPGQSYTAPSASVVLHGGDWHAGFNAYKLWLASWDKSQTPHPDWLNRSFYMRRDYPLGGTGLLYDEGTNHYTFDKLVKESKALGGLDFIDISGWALSDTHGRVGDYPIELGGKKDLRDNIEKARGEQIPTGLYFEGHLIDKNSDIGREKGAEWQVLDKELKGLWWPHGSPEMFACPHITSWQRFLADRMTDVAKETGAEAVYLDEFGCGSRHCFASDHGHPIGANEIEGEIGMLQQVRRTLDSAGRRSTIVYTECAPVDIATPYVDGSFTYALPSSQASAYGVKLNLWRFAFPKARLWDMVTSGVEPHILSAEDFRYAFWLGDGVWLKGRANTWYGDEILEFLRWAHPQLLKHAAALTGEAEPLAESPDPEILVNRFRGGGETVYTLFNRSYETKTIIFHGKNLVMTPRGVEMVAVEH
jgi:hypothetical protein